MRTFRMLIDFRMLRVAPLLVIAVLVLNGCDGSSSAENGASVVNDAAMPALSHAFTRVPSTGVEPDNDPLLSASGQALAADLPESLAVLYEVVENHGADAGVDCRALGAEFASCSVTNLHLRDSEGRLAAGGWRLYFHSIRRILAADSAYFQAGFVNGDLHFIEPKAGYRGLPEGLGSVRFVTEFSHLQHSDFMPRYWLVRADGSTVLLANTTSDSNPLDYARPLTGDNRFAYNGEPNSIASTASRYALNAPVDALAASIDADTAQRRIVPKPAELIAADGRLPIAGGFDFSASALPPASIAALEARQAQFMSTSKTTPVSLLIDAQLSPESYTLNVDADGIRIRGQNEQALFHGAQSLLALVQPGTGTLPHVAIRDSPRFAYRGVHVDIARNYQGPEQLERLLDQMAAYKLNTLQLHLSDDEGWRLEIPSLPELARVGGQRRFVTDAAGAVNESDSLMPQLGSGPSADNAGSGYLSRAEFIALLRYARDRYIDIIPVFDMPGHARAAVIAMRARAAALGRADDPTVRIDDPDDTSRYLTVQHFDDSILNPCVDGTWRFINTLIDDVSAMYAEAGAALSRWHMGGDEARNILTGAGFTGNFQGSVNTAEFDEPWEGSPACQALIEQRDELNGVDDLAGWFVRRVAERVANAGIPALYAYQDILDGLSAVELPTREAFAGFWRVIHQGGHTGAAELVRRGFNTVIAPPDFLYFDFPQEIHPAERGFYWGARQNQLAKVFSFAPENLPQNAETSLTRDGAAWQATSTEEKVSVAGIQAHLWTETVRTAEQFDYMLFPRLLALAERAWHRADWELPYAIGQTYSRSSNRVDRAALERDLAGFLVALARKELPKLDAAGVRYRIPVPGASLTNGVLALNLEIPGLPLEYSSDGLSWEAFNAARAPVGAFSVRARSADAKRSGRSSELP